jgi:hypothetical protein
LRIRYTMNMTTKMAHSRPTTAPPITAAKTIHINMSNSSEVHIQTTNIIQQRFPTLVCACTHTHTGAHIQTHNL